MLDIESMVSLLRRAAQLPHTTSADVFMTAGMMAEAIESVSPAPAKTKEGAAKVRLTTKRLGELGLYNDAGDEWPSVADCAWHLVNDMKMTHAQAAKRMAATVQQVNMAVTNYRMRNGLNNKEKTNV